MTELMMKMAQAAAEDDTLFASSIHRYALQQNCSWEQVAHRLQIETKQLAKLALCRLPQPSLVSGEVRQVADYVGMARTTLQGFLNEVEGKPVVETIAPKRAVHSQRIGIDWEGIKQGVLIMFSPRRAWVLGVVAVMMLLGAFVLAQPDKAVATLVVTQGQAAVLSAGLGNRETQAVAGEALAVGTGDVITVGAEGAAELRLIDGSMVELAADTAVNVTELVISDSSYRVRLQMLAGRTISRVERVLGVGDRFEINTPSSTASVRGTVFTVEIISLTETFVACERGKVEVAMGEEVALVEAGMMITAVVGQPLQTELQDVQSPAAPVNNDVTDEAEETEPVVTLTPVATATSTPEDTPTDTPMPMATVTVSVTNSLAPTVTKTITPTIIITPLPTATPAPVGCTGEDSQPQGATLAENYGVSYNEIMGWFCAGFGFGEIAQAYDLSEEAGASVAEILGMRQAGMGWGQIRQALLDNNGNNGQGNGNNGNNGQGNGNDGNNGQGNGNDGNNGQGTGNDGNNGQGNDNDGNNGGGNNNGGGQGNGNGGGKNNP